MPSWISKTLDKVNLASRDCHRQAMFNIILHLLHVRMKVILLDWVIVQFPFQYDHTYYQVSLKYEAFVSWRFEPSHNNNWSRVIDWVMSALLCFIKIYWRRNFLFFSVVDTSSFASVAEEDTSNLLCLRCFVVVPLLISRFVIHYFSLPCLQETVCNCNRAPETIFCQKCGKSFVGRRRMSCERHRNTIHLMDCAYCVFCKRQL